MPAALTSASRLQRPLFVLAGALGVSILAATAALWAHYGTVVFFEMVRAGLAACF